MFQLSSRAEDLRRETTDLTGREADLLDQIERGKPENKTSTNEAKHWLDAVQKVRSDAEKFLIDFQRREGFSPQFSYQLGCRAERLLKDVRRLTAEIRDLPVLAQAPPDRVVYWPKRLPAIGVENILSKICGLMEDEDSRIIGIYGMGGVGKTTLLKIINNNFFDKSSGRFDLVILIERIDSPSEIVSNNVRIDRIQEEIGTWLGYSRPGGDRGPELPRDPDCRKRKLCTSLIQKQFLLLLDDLWESLDLDEIGIPVSRKGSKIVFTTRSRRVCQDMEADQVEVPCLDPASSWKLFCRSLGNTEDQLSESTRSLAQSVAEKCGGLPLALVTVGHAMADARTDCEWEMALDTLRGGAAEVDGIKEVRDVLEILKFSFDRYKDEGHKECLLYCSLFPQGPTVYIDDLIEYWIGEGFLETLNCPIRTARSRCQRAITALKAACLLDEGHETDISKTFVKLHDMVREMALWISDKDCKADEKTIFALGPSQMPECAEMSKKWTYATRISLMSNRIGELPESPQWSNLRTLLLRGSSNLEQIPSGFFESVPRLTVLDLSRTNINRLPPEICFLVELRYLNLKGTPLELLPKEVGKLTNLRILNLDQLYKLKEIPKEAISSLSSLQSLTMHYGSYIWRGGWKDNGSEYKGREVCLKDLVGLEQLEELQLEVVVNFNEDLLGLSHCHRLCSVIRSLRLVNLGSFLSSDLFDILGYTKDLRMLNIKSCLPHGTSFTLDLRNLLIFPADHLTKLETIQLWDVPVESIAGMDSSVFGKKAVKGAKSQNFQDLKIPRLREITLINMKNFKSICGKPLLFPNLKVVHIENCPKLEKLPFELNGATCLENLNLNECTKILEIIALEEFEIAIRGHKKNSFFPRLRTIMLQNMQNLKSICKQPLLFPNLKEVYVINCQELEKLPFELNSASCLETLTLRKCTKMVEIIGVEELEMIIEKDTFLYSIREITLEDMQNLRSICKQPSVFPSLKEMGVINCPALEKLPFELNSATCLKTLVLKECTKMVEILAVEESEVTNVQRQKDSIFSSLTTITLENMQNLKHICGQPLLFPSLKEMSVLNCPKLEKLPFELTSATCLETLFLKECTKIVEILPIEASQMTNVQGQKDSIFYSLTNIALENMQDLKSICEQPLLFPSLKRVQVLNCPNLEKLPFELTSATCLKTLVLKECTKMVEILPVEASQMTNVQEQKDSIFSSLTSITLENMYNLKSICGQPMLFPRLESVVVINCPELEKLPIELDRATCLETLVLNECTKMVEILAVQASMMTTVHTQKHSIFCRLINLILVNMQNLKSICGHPLLFLTLKRVDVINCPELEKLPFELTSATCLETLFIKECTKMIEILAIEAAEVPNAHAQKDSIFSSLTTITLENMQNLKHICGQPLLFPSLKEMFVVKCPELEKLPFELNSATCLETLFIRECTKMVEILAIEEPEMTNVHRQYDSMFSSLTTLTLENMHNLKSIFGQPLLFPSLKKIWVVNCPNLEKLSFELTSARCLETLFLKDCTKMVEILPVEASQMTDVHRQRESIFSSLTFIGLENMQNLKSICGQPLLFPSLKKIAVVNCPELEKLPFELNSATCLETLFIRECTKMVEILAIEEPEMTNVHRQHDSIFSSLTTLTLENMHNLKSIFGQPLLFPILKEMYVVNCPKIEKLPFELTSATCLETLFLKECTKMVEILPVEASQMTDVRRQRESIFSSLTTICLESMQNLKSICGQPLLFPSLKKIAVVNCPKLEKLPFELTSATCLEILILKECPKMVEILAAQASVVTNVHTQKHSIFCSLIDIILVNMQNLKSICGQPLLFLTLKRVDVINCPELEKLPFELTSATCLETLFIKECTKMVEIFAIEAAKVPNVHAQKYSIFSSLTTIKLVNMHNLKSICGQHMLFPSLKEMCVINCPELENLPFDVNSATCLETLVMEECPKIVEILAIEEPEMTNVHRQNDSLFSSLTTVKLENMHNLKRICGQHLLFPGLKEAHVENCPALEMLPFELNSVTCLETLVLKECSKMVEVIALQESEVPNVQRQKDSIFSSLTTITLENMQNLKHICGQPLLFPSLKEMSVRNCPKLEKLPFELTSATCLETLFLKECTKMVEILPVEASQMTDVHRQRESIFSSLTTIFLDNMQNLKSICGQPLLFPSLKEMCVINCPELENLPFDVNSATCLETLFIIECTKMVEILAIEEPEMTNVHRQNDSLFSSLTIVKLENMHNLKRICGQHLLFPGLKEAHVENCPALEMLPFELNSATCLETLVLKECSKMVEVIALQESEVPNVQRQKDSIFSSLTTISLENMQNLKHICGQPLLFPSLKEMSVLNCPKLEKLPFELTSATCLETLVLKECTKMVEILPVEASQMTDVHRQRESIFSSLTTIFLDNMQNLKSICGQPLLFPSLKKIAVVNCPELEKLPFELNSATCLETLFIRECTKMVEILAIEEPEMTNGHRQNDSLFSSLTTVKLENMHNLKRICGQHLLFPGLKEAHVENCPALEMLPFELNSATCLETLVLKECSKMVEVIALQESEVPNVHRQIDSIFSSLTTITLENMQNLKHICGQPLLFPSLKEMSVLNCPKLEKLPFELTSATCLETLVLKECTKIVEILPVEASQMTDVHRQRESIFSSLTTIFLDNMQNLKSICGQPLLFPSLKKIAVVNCPELEKLPFELNSATCLETLFIIECTKMVEILAIEEQEMTNVHRQNDSLFSSLTTVKLENMHNLKRICGQHLLFPGLKEAHVENCPALEMLPFELNSATCLETLVLKECSKMVEIIPLQESEVPNVHRQIDSIFSSLTTISLENMQNLKHICGQPLLFPSLKEMSVLNCPKLEKLPFELTSATCLETLFLKECTKMVEILPVEASQMTDVHRQRESIFSSLTTIFLDNMQNLKSICGQPLLFRSLKKIAVVNCPKLEKLPFELTSATCLEILILKECPKMVEILAPQASVVTNVHTQKHSIFCSLIDIILENMQNLKSICGQPLLFLTMKRVDVINCPELEKLPFELTSATCLETLFIKECTKMIEIFAIEAAEVPNAHAQKYSIFSSLTTITLVNMHNFKSICGQPLLFPGLREVHVENCPALEMLPFELNSATCLETLVLKECSKMVEILAVEESEVTNVQRQKDSIFSSLTTITLENMQNLKHICGQPLLFPSLKEMSVLNCPKLEKLPFELTSATCLETLFLKECTKIVEILPIEASQMTDVQGQKDSIFYSLTNIALENMQNLKSICGQPLLFPSLKKMLVVNCPELEKLPFELTSATCLEILILNECSKMVEILPVEASQMTDVHTQRESIFSNLTTICLENMHNLKSICGQPLLFPSLKKIVVVNCPELEKLPFELTSATCLETLILIECTKMVEILAVEESEVTNVHRKNDSLFSSLTTVKLENMHNLKRICGHPLLFLTLKRVDVINCPELEKLPFELTSATCLETLYIKECSKMVEIFAIEAAEVPNVNAQKYSIFSSLTTITLVNMHNLKSICGQPLLFPRLKEMCVVNCPELENLPFEIDRAPCLETLAIEECTKMVEIFASHPSEVTNVHAQKHSIFCSLKVIILKNMQNLKSICGQTLLFPSLKRANMVNCPQLEKLPFGIDRAPCLKTLILIECHKMVNILAVQAFDMPAESQMFATFLLSLLEDY